MKKTILAVMMVCGLSVPAHAMTMHSGTALTASREASAPVLLAFADTAPPKATAGAPVDAGPVAQPAPVEVDAAGLLGRAADLFRSKEWMTLGFTIVLLLTGLFRRYLLGHIEWARTPTGGWVLAAGTAALVEVLAPLSAGAHFGVATIGAFVAALLAAGKVHTIATKGKAAAA